MFFFFFSLMNDILNICLVKIYKLYVDLKSWLFFFKNDKPNIKLIQKIAIS